MTPNQENLEKVLKSFHSEFNAYDRNWVVMASRDDKEKSIILVVYSNEISDNNFPDSYQGYKVEYIKSDLEINFKVYQ